MGERHLVISDLHENHQALLRFIDLAGKTPGGFNDIWFLGDFFGHSDQAIGLSNLTQAFFDKLRVLDKIPSIAVWGNWEYWLGHPEQDYSGKMQRDQEFPLKQRRLILTQKNNRKLLDKFLKSASLVYPAGPDAQFTLFHGCSYACHGNSDYQPKAWECYLYPRDLNIVTRGLFGSPEHLSTPHFLFGHTHMPGYFVYSNSSLVAMWRFFTVQESGETVFYGNPNQRYGINPGSAGIAMNGIPRTALLLDTEAQTFTWLTDQEDEND